MSTGGLTGNEFFHHSSAGVFAVSPAEDTGRHAQTSVQYIEWVSKRWVCVEPSGHCGGELGHVEVRRQWTYEIVASKNCV
jgi:hypothetical protein